MIKRYVMLISAILVILMFTSTSSASFLFYEEKIYERLPENSPLRKILDRFSQVIVSNNDNSVSIYDENDDEDYDVKYDDGEHDADDLGDGPIEDILLPNVLEEGFYWTPDGGNEPVVEEDNLGTPPTIDIDGEEGTTLNEDPIIDEDGEIGRTLYRVIEVITEINVKIGPMLEKIVEHTYAPGTTESDGVAENIVDTVVVAGEPGGTAENNIVDNVVVTDNN